MARNILHSIILDDFGGMIARLALTVVIFFFLYVMVYNAI